MLLQIYFNVTLATNVIILNAVGFNIQPSNVVLSLDPLSPITPPVPAITGVRMNATEEFLYVDLAVNILAHSF